MAVIVILADFFQLRLQDCTVVVNVVRPFFQSYFLFDISMQKRQHMESIAIIVCACWQYDQNADICSSEPLSLR